VCEQSAELPTASAGTGLFNSVSPFPKTGTDPSGANSKGPAGVITAGSLVSFDERIPSQMNANDLSRWSGSIFTVDERLEASNTLVLRAAGSCETFGCIATHRRLRLIDCPGESTQFPEFVLDFASSVAAGSIFESKPFAACGLLWAVRVTPLSHTDPIQTQSRFPPPAPSTTSCLPNSISGSRYQVTVGPDTTQRNCKFMTMTLMPEYAHVSLEELRAGDYAMKSACSPQESQVPTKSSIAVPCLQTAADLRYFILCLAG
jgi:hypothetical protein